MNERYKYAFCLLGVLVGTVGLLDLIQENRQYDIDRMMGLRVWCVSVLGTYTID